MAHQTDLVELRRFARNRSLVRSSERARAVALVAEGRTRAEVASILDRNAHSVGAWVARYQQRGIEGLIDAEKSGRPRVLREADVEFLLDAVRRSPQQFGLKRADWRCNALADLIERERGVKVSDERVRQVLKKNGITFSRAKIHVVSPDPEYAKKKSPSSAASERGRRTR